MSVHLGGSCTQRLAFVPVNANELFTIPASASGLVACSTTAFFPLPIRTIAGHVLERSSIGPESLSLCSACGQTKSTRKRSPAGAGPRSFQLEKLKE